MQPCSLSRGFAMALMGKPVRLVAPGAKPAQCQKTIPFEPGYADWAIKTERGMNAGRNR